MSLDRSDYSPSVATTIETDNDGTPLYYCDRNLKSSSNTMKAERTLYAVSVLTTIFIIVEFLGGYFANSLAVMTDAGHMVSDLLSFLISIVAIKLAQKKPTKRLNFGYHRAEVLGAVVSVLMIWVLTAILVYAAIERIRFQNFEVNDSVMLYTALIGVVFNLIMGAVLYFGKTSHTHLGMSHNHHHDCANKTFPANVENSVDRSHEIEVKDEKEGTKGVKWSEIKKASKPRSNINLRAAFIHVLGDLVQSFGVVSAAIIIKFTGYRLADPICTFLFSLLVLITTFSVMRDAVMVMMEAAPGHINNEHLLSDLREIEGVRDVHSLRVWSLTMDKAAVSVHLDTEKECDSNHVVHEANEKLRFKHGIHFVTVQVQCVCSRSVSLHSLAMSGITIQTTDQK